MGNVILGNFGVNQAPRTTHAGSLNPAGARVERLVTKTLPLDAEAIRTATSGIAIFLSRMLEERDVQVGLSEEEVSLDSLMRVFAANDTTYEIKVRDFIEGMLEKPEQVDHIGLENYLRNLLGHISIEPRFLPYVMSAEGIALVKLRAGGLEKLFDAAIVGEYENALYFFEVRTNNADEAIRVFPEDFVSPRKIPLLDMITEYFLSTTRDALTVYQEDTPIEIVRYYNGVQYIIEGTYGEVLDAAVQVIKKRYRMTEAVNNKMTVLGAYHRNEVTQFLRNQP